MIWYSVDNCTAYLRATNHHHRQWNQWNQWKRSKLWYFKMGPQVQQKCFRHVQHMRNNWELRKRGYLIRFGHTGALLFLEKKDIKRPFFPALQKLTHMITLSFTNIVVYGRQNILVYQHILKVNFTSTLTCPIYANHFKMNTDTTKITKKHLLW